MPFYTDCIIIVHPKHRMAWKTIFESIVTGTATALTWVVLVAASNALRNFILERRLHRSFSRVGYSFGENAFGLIFHNTTSVPVKVWGASFSFSGGGTAPLRFSGEKVAHRKIRLHRFKEPRWHLVDFPPFQSEEREGAVELDFDISGTWEISKERVITLSPPPEGAYCLIEYTTLIRTKKRFAVIVTQVDDLQDAFLRCRGRWVKDGDAGSHKGEQNGAANGSQPIRSEINRTSPAAGSRRGPLH
jgi:hypothetical protein